MVKDRKEVDGQSTDPEAWRMTREWISWISLLPSVCPVQGAAEAYEVDWPVGTDEKNLQEQSVSPWPKAGAVCVCVVLFQYPTRLCWQSYWGTSLVPSAW